MNTIELSYEQARDFLITRFKKLMNSHEQGNYSEIHQGFDEFDALVPRSSSPRFRKVLIALSFWDGWIDASNHNWDYYEGISKDDWPQLCRTIIRDLSSDRDLTNRAVVDLFSGR